MEKSLESYVQHLHLGCLHPYRVKQNEQGILDPNFHVSQLEVKLVDFNSGQRVEGNIKALVLHPRWCSDCLTERRNIIWDVSTPKLSRKAARDMTAEGKTVKKVKMTIAYRKGRRDGRIIALNDRLDPMWVSGGVDLGGEEEKETLEQKMAALSLGFAIGDELKEAGVGDS